MNRPRIVLVGNPNTGKSTIFNALTGQRQHISNWTGTTVACHQATVSIGGEEALLVDLPGVYSLTPYSEDERIARDYLLDHEIDLFINVVDAANLERNLYLTMQLLETGLPIVLVLNKIDVANRRGSHIDVATLSQLLGIPVFSTIADRAQGLDLLRSHLPLVEFDRIQDHSRAPVAVCQRANA